MAYSKSSLLEKSSGKVGNTIFYSWNEEVYARAKPGKVTNPKTGKQQANRKNVGFLVNAFRQLRPLLIISLNVSERLTPWSYSSRLLSKN
jgi:hypothetical protein